jgi:hypothetical protein
LAHTIYILSFISLTPITPVRQLTINRAVAHLSITGLHFAKRHVSAYSSSVRCLLDDTCEKEKNDSSGLLDDTCGGKWIISIIDLLSNYFKYYSPWDSFSENHCVCYVWHNLVSADFFLSTIRYSYSCSCTAVLRHIPRRTRPRWSILTLHSL